MYDGVRHNGFAYNPVMDDIGLTRAAAMVDATAQSLGYDNNYGYAQISLEVVPDYAADLVFIGRYDTAPINEQTQLVLDTTPAAEADQVYRVDANIWTFHLVQAEIGVLRRVDEILSGGVKNLGDY